MLMPSVDVLPFHIFLWKIASRCNINCSYCYIYNLDDTTWRDQPHFMSAKVAQQAATRMLEHCRAHDKTDVVITFHGGEPLLGGVKHLDMLTSVVRRTLVDGGVDVQFGMQSNGLLFTPELGDLMLERAVGIGVSIDGPPEVNDVYRVDHRGRPTSARLEKALDVLMSERYRSLFRGFLCVINPDTDPVAVTKYFLAFDDARVDFLLPDNNHANPPIGKQQNRDATPYGDWLIRSFDYWFSHSRRNNVRIFSSIIKMLLGGPSEVEALGVGPVDLIVVEANGDVEAVDTLKSTFHGAAKLGYNVFAHDFDTVARHQAIRSRQSGVGALCRTCQACPVVRVCGGGYLPHRFSKANGFDNPSVYCADLLKLIEHIASAIVRELDTAQLLA
jgi:uncharacterized protein